MKNRKRLVAAVIVAALIIATPLAAMAAPKKGNDIKQGTQDGITYRISNNKCQIISYETSEKKIRTLNIPDTIENAPVVSISVNAFKNIPVVKVTMPDTVTTIEEYAFYNCSLLKTVEMNGVKTIGTSAFAN